MKKIYSNHFTNFLKFKIERFLIRGPLYQFLFIAMVILLISVGSGYILGRIELLNGGVLEGTWWAFLRLSDPGYLGDDEGLAKRGLGLILTVLGYVVFLGAFVAVMTQWLTKTMKQLESGLTPISMRGHIAILGYTNRTPSIAYEIFSSENRLKRFLRGVDRSLPHLVILNPEVNYELTQDLKSHLKSYWNSHLITFRSGDAIKHDELIRVDPIHAAAIILPASTFSGQSRDRIDARTIKTILSIKNLVDEKEQELPRIVAEILDARKVNLAEQAYGSKLHVICSETLICRLMAQNIHHPGLSYVYSEILRHEGGNGLYVKKFEESYGKKWDEISNYFENGIAVGILKRGPHSVCMLCPEDDYQIESGDTFIFIAGNYDEIELNFDIEVPFVEKSQHSRTLKPFVRKERHILVLGWAVKICRLLLELDAYEKETTRVDIVSMVPITERERFLKESYLNLKHVSISQIEMDYTLPQNLDRMNMHYYSNIVFMASDAFDNVEDADARSVLGYLLLRDTIRKSKSHTPILIELLDPENEALFRKQWGEVIVSPLIVSQILANVALRPDLFDVFDDLFDSGGAEFSFLNPDEIDGFGNRSFWEISQKVKTLDMIAIGIKLKEKDQPVLNPKPHARFMLEVGDRIIVIS